MMGLMGLPLAFAEPLVLLGLLSLPVLWWLLRLIPPQPRRIDFAPTRLLFDLTPKEETPRRTPRRTVAYPTRGAVWGHHHRTRSGSSPLRSPARRKPPRAFGRVAAAAPKKPTSSESYGKKSFYDYLFE